MKLTLMLIFFLVSTVPLFAYIDPGTGSYLIQIIIAGALAGSFIIKTQWKRLVSLFRKWRGLDTTEKKDEAK